MSFSPDRLAVGRERWVVAGFVVALVVLVLAEVAHDFRPEKLSIVFMALVYGPLVVLHEAGHAVACRALGWRVLRIEIGRGRRIVRFRVGEVPVDIRWLPVGGFVVPAPVRLRRPRLESAVIYAAGPGIELLLALGVGLGVGLERLLSASPSLGVIFAQSMVAVVGLHLFFNLVPLGVSDGPYEDGPTDGLGVLLSPFLKPWDFAEMLARPWRLRIQGEPSAERRAEICREGLRQLPANPHLELLLADALGDLGDVYGAREHRLKALDSGHMPDALAAQLRARVGR
jgi:hypothetical protein